MIIRWWQFLGHLIITTRRTDVEADNEIKTRSAASWIGLHCTDLQFCWLNCHENHWWHSNSLLCLAPKLSDSALSCFVGGLAQRTAKDAHVV